MLELWGMQSTPSLPSLLGLLWPSVVATDRVQSMGQIERNCGFEILLFLRFKLRTYDKLNCLTCNSFVCSNVLFEMELFLTFKLCVIKIYIYTILIWIRTVCQIGIKMFWELSYVIILNWIAWNWTDYLYKNGFGIK